MKTSLSLNPNSIEWKCAYDLGYWSAVCIVPIYDGSFARGARHVCVNHARDLMSSASRAQRRAFGAAVKSSLTSSLAMRRQRVA